MKISKSGAALKELIQTLKQINVQFTCKKIQMGLSHTHILLTTELLKQCTVYNNIIVIIIGLKVDTKHTVEPDEKDVCTEHLTHSLHNRCPKERSVFSVESHFKGVQQILCFLSPM